MIVYDGTYRFSTQNVEPDSAEPFGLELRVEWLVAG